MHIVTIVFAFCAAHLFGVEELTAVATSNAEIRERASAQFAGGLDSGSLAAAVVVPVGLVVAATRARLPGSAELAAFMIANVIAAAASAGAAFTTMFRTPSALAPPLWTFLGVDSGA